MMIYDPKKNKYLDPMSGYNKFKIDEKVIDIFKEIKEYKEKRCNSSFWNRTFFK